MKRLIKGEEPVPPSSARPAASWDDLVLQARSHDGRQRQAAVRALAASGHAPALPVMLERLNDWVDAIRRDARVAVENFLREDFVDAWIASLGPLAALARARRADHSALRRWNDDMRHTFVVPIAAQRDRIRHAWAALRDQLPRALQVGVAFHLRSFGVIDA